MEGIFLIIVSPVIDKTKGIGGTFTEGQQYPVLEIRDSPGFGLMLVIPDDTGEIRQYKAENFHYVWTESNQIRWRAGN